MRVSEFVFHLFNALLQRLLVFLQLFELSDHIGFGRVDDLRHAVQRIDGLLELPQRSLARNCLDAAHTGRDAAFIDDLAEADIARAPNVRAATKLLAEMVD